MNAFILRVLYFSRLDVSDRLMLIRQANQKSAIIVVVGNFYIKALCFNQMSAMDAMIYE